MAAMLDVQHKGICYKNHWRIQPTWVADIVRHIPRDCLQTKNIVRIWTLQHQAEPTSAWKIDLS